ncbi:MAG: DUF4403 family protein [Methyloceanibacter sp.]
MRHLLAGCLVLLAGTGVGLLSSPPLVLAQGAAELPVSRIPIVLKTSWPALTALADSAIPKCSGRYPVCQGSEASDYILRHEDDWFVVATILGRDIGMKGSMWRFDPLELSLTDGNLMASQNILYRAKIGFTQRDDAQSCGFDEPAREIMTGAGGKIAFSPDWYVDFIFKPVLRPEVHCGTIFERVDLAKWSAPVMERAMDAATEKVRVLVREQTKIREQVMPIWAKMQEPIALGQGAWLDIRPYAAFANVPEVTDNGQYLTMKVGLEARPRVILGARPVAGTNPLPPLTGTAQGPAFNVNLNAIVEYNKMARLLRQKLVGQTFAAGESWPARRIRVTVRDVQVEASGGRVVISLAVTGFFRGTLRLMGTPIFRDRGRLRGEITIANIDYTVETRNLLVRLTNRIFQNRVRRSLQANAKFDISDELARAYQEINQALNSELTPTARLAGNLTNFGPGRIWVRKTGVEAAYRVSGEVMVVVNPF